LWIKCHDGFRERKKYKIPGALFMRDEASIGARRPVLICPLENIILPSRNFRSPSGRETLKQARPQDFF